jgi:polyisoprenyl-phosphate glycosyltransferase
MLSILVPVYNNAGTLRELAARIAAALPRMDYEVVFVNDGSLDGSAEILQGLARDNERHKVILLSRNFGQHPAISAALEHARGDSFVLMDADLQDRPEDIPALLAPLAGGHEVVYSTMRGSGRRPQRLTSALFHYVFSRIVGVEVPPDIGTFRAFSARVRDALLQFPERRVLYGPLMFYIGFRSTFVEVEHVQRAGQASSYTFGKRLALALNALLSYTDLPHRILVYLGVLLVLGSVFYGLITIIGYLWLGLALPQGLNLIVLLLVLVLGSLMASVGILGAYLFRVYEEVLRRPRYLVAGRINVSAPEVPWRG